MKWQRNVSVRRRSWAAWTILALALPAVPAAVVPAAAQDAPPIRDSERITRNYVMSWRDLKRQYVVMQRRDYSCGAAALATLLRYYWGADVDEQTVLTQLEKILKPAELRDRVENGLSLTDLRRAAVGLEYDATIGKLSLDKLMQSKVPVIVAIRIQKLDHFVVVRGFADGYAYLADPIRGNVRTPIHEFASQWIANALLVVLHPDLDESDASQLSIMDYEIDPCWLNRQVVRTRPEKTFPR